MFEVSLIWAVVGFIAGWKACAHVMTYKFAWKQCCLRHYKSEEHRDEE